MWIFSISPRNTALNQMLEFFSPTNFLMTNPDALKEAMDTKGKSLVDGLENLVEDLEKNDGEFNVSLTDETAFEIGNNIANSEGSVIYQNKLYQKKGLRCNKHKGN